MKLEIFIVGRNSDGVEECEQSIRENSPSDIRIFHAVSHHNCSWNHNNGLRQVSADFGLSLHSDCRVVSKGWLDSMMETMLKFDDIALVGPKIIYPDGRIHSAGTAPNFRPYFNGQPDCGRREYAEEVMGLDSNCLLYRMSAFRQMSIFGFDERFTGASQFHDTDLCLRLRQEKWRIFYDGRVKILHAKKQKPTRPWDWNHLYFHFKHPSTLWRQYQLN